MNGMRSRVGVVVLIVLALIGWAGVSNAQECTPGADADGRPICHDHQPPQNEHEWYAEGVSKAIVFYSMNPDAGGPGPSFPSGNPNNPGTFGVSPSEDLQDALETVITSVTPDSGVDEVAQQGREQHAQKVDDALRDAGEFVEGIAEEAVEVANSIAEAVVNVLTPKPDPEPRTPSYTDCMVHAELCQAEQQEAADEFHRGANNRQR